MTPQQFLQLADPFPDAMALVTGDGTILAANRRFAAELRRPAGDLRGKRLAELASTAPEQIAAYLRGCSRSREMLPGSLEIDCGAKRFAFRCEGAVVEPRRNGSEALIELRLVPKDKSISRFLALNEQIGGLSREIHRRQAAEAELQRANAVLEREVEDRRGAQLALREKQQELAAILDNSTALVYVKDRDGRYLAVNRQWEVVTGRSAEEVVGKTVHDLYPSEAAARLCEDDLKVLESGAARQFEESVPLGDGIHTFVSSKFPLYDAEGNIYAVGGISTDITARTRAEDELRRSREELADFVENATIGLHWVGPDGIIKWANRAELDLLGYAPEEYIGHHIAEFHVDQPAIDEILARLRGNEELHDYEARLRAKDGSIRRVAITSNVFRRDGEFIHTRCFTRDITERRRAEEALKQRTRALETLNRINVSLASQLELDRLVQAVTDAGTDLTGAEFGAFFYNVTNEAGESYLLYSLAGVPREKFANFPMPRNTELFAPTFGGEAVIRLDDVTRDPRFGRNAPYYGMPEGHLPVRSYLAVPVISRSGAVIGGLFFGHSQPGVFQQEAEDLITGLASQAAVAIDNAQLYGALRAREDEARRRLAELQSIYATAPIGLCFLDRDLRFVKVNEQMAIVNGCLVEEHLGRTLREVLPHAAEQVEPLYQRVLDTGEAILDLEIHGTRPGTLDVERDWLVSYYPVKDAAGEVLGVNTVVQDVTERRRIENILSVLAETSTLVVESLEYKATLENVARLVVPRLADWCAVDFREDDGTISQVAIAHSDPAKAGLAQELRRRYPLDPDGSVGVPRVLRTGAPEVFSAISDELLRRNARDDEHLRILRKLGLRSAIVLPLVARGRTIGAITLVNSENTHRYTPADLPLLEELAHTCALAVDNARLYQAAQGEIAARARAEEALRSLNEDLRQKNREMEQFVYTVSHDLKSPLVTMMGFMGILSEDVAQGRLDEVTDSVERIERATHRMNRLIDDLLQLSRIGRVKHEPEWVDVTALVEDVGEELSERLEEAGAELDVQPAMPRVVADPVRIRDVFENLLTNAIKYACGGPSPRIAVGAESTGGEVRYFVRDNGPGIEERYHDKIFGLFQRLDTTKEGTGIGLAIVSRIMQVHGGRAWIDSQPGRGATFWLAFPTPGKPNGEE